MIEVPLAVVPRKLSGTKKQASELPVGTDLLEHERNGIRAFLGCSIENRNAVSSRRQVGNYKLGAVGGLSGGAKNSTQEFRPRQGSSPFGFQFERRARGGMSTGQVRLILRSEEHTSELQSLAYL